LSLNLKHIRKIYFSSSFGQIFEIERDEVPVAQLNNRKRCGTQRNPQVVNIAYLKAKK
jgi:hypothetical protein